jgi:hypothetical protein
MSYIDTPQRLDFYIDGLDSQIFRPVVAHNHRSWKGGLKWAIDLLRMVKIGAPEIRI